jgi:hypothetical protein
MQGHGSQLVLGLGLSYFEQHRPQFQIVFEQFPEFEQSRRLADSAISLVVCPARLSGEIGLEDHEQLLEIFAVFDSFIEMADEYKYGLIYLGQPKDVLDDGPGIFGLNFIKRQQFVDHFFFDKPIECHIVFHVLVVEKAFVAAKKGCDIFEPFDSN